MGKIEGSSVGSVTRISGPGFIYRRAGNVSRFEQVGKIPSIRAAKAVCKLMAEVAGSCNASK